MRLNLLAVSECRFAARGGGPLHCRIGSRLPAFDLRNISTRIYLTPTMLRWFSEPAAPSFFIRSAQ